MTAAVLLLALALTAALGLVRRLTRRAQALRPAVERSNVRRIDRTPEGAKVGEAISGRQRMPAAEASSPAQLISAGTPNTDGSPRAGGCGHPACLGSIDMDRHIADALAVGNGDDLAARVQARRDDWRPTLRLIDQDRGPAQ